MRIAVLPAFADPVRLADELQERAAAAARRVFLLDYDGTLVPFASLPRDARPDSDLLHLLGALGAAHEVWIVSGRGKDDLEQMLGFLPVSLGAEHGAWARPRDDDRVVPWQRLIPASNVAAELSPALAALVQRHPGTRLERKESSVAWHYRQADPQPSERALALIEENLRALARAHGADLLTAVMAFELRTRGANKGLVVAFADRRRRFDDAFVFAAGDDVTDADLLRATPKNAVRLAVGDRLVDATHRVASPEALRLLLTRLGQT